MLGVLNTPTAYQCLDKIIDKRLISLDSLGHRDHELSVSRTVLCFMM